MTTPPLTPLNLLGGPNGGYRFADQTAPGGPVDPSNRADDGTSTVASGTCFRTGRAYAIKDAGIRAGEIIGYRAWMLTKDYRLRSMFHDDYIWTPGGTERSEVVDGVYGAGLHAFKSLAQAHKQYDCYGVAGTVIFGTVDLWGEVIEHEGGYRAEYAAVHSVIESFNLNRSYPPIIPILRRIRWRFWKPRGPSIEDRELAEVRARYCAASTLTL